MILKFNEDLPTEIREQFDNIAQSCQIDECIILTTEHNSSTDIYFLKNNLIEDKSTVNKINLSFSMDNSKNIMLVDDFYSFPYMIFNVDNKECYFANFVKEI